MRNSKKVAKWEYKKNMKSKSFIISLLLTPALFLLFAFLPGLFDSFNQKDEVTVYVQDEINALKGIEPSLKAQGITWNIEKTEKNMSTYIKEHENTAYLLLNETAVNNGRLEVFTNESMPQTFDQELSALAGSIQLLQLESLSLTPEQTNLITQGISIESVAVSEETKEENPLKRLVPGILAGAILLSVITTGMMIFQSASGEKKEKVSEIVLSSITPGELMQGKIIGYFALGMTQAFVWIICLLPFFIWKLDFPVVEYLLVPETIVLVFIAILGYLLFAALFAGLGASFEDVDSTSNFQGIVFILPWLPLFLIAPVLNDPTGIIAQAASYFPLTAPGILIIRLSVLEQWPWLEIIVSLSLLIVSIWVLMKIAGKIFSIGILKYGKNATPQEMLKWLKY